MNLFDTTSFMPHKHCYLEAQSLLTWNMIGNFWIFIAYCLIPIALAFFIYKHRDTIRPYKTMVTLFCMFILSCGGCHLLDVIVTQYPIYLFQTIWVCWTAFISLVTFAYLVPYMRGVKMFHQTSNGRVGESIGVAVPIATVTEDSDLKRELTRKPDVVESEDVPKSTDN